MLGRARLQAPAQCRPVPLLLPGLLGWLRGTEQSQSKPAVPRAAGTSHRAPHPPIPHPRAPPPAAAAGLRNSSWSPIKGTLVLKGARAGFHKHEQHKSRLSPARLTLFSLPPHLLLAKGLNGSSMCCGRLKPRREQRGRSLGRLAEPLEKAAPKENICALASTRARFLPVKSLIKVVFIYFVSTRADTGSAGCGGVSQGSVCFAGLENATWKGGHRGQLCVQPGSGEDWGILGLL